MHELVHDLLPLPEVNNHLALEKCQIGFRLAEDELFDQPVEEFADMFRSPAIETKGILVKIPLQVLSRHSALVCRPQAAFNQRSDQVNMGEMLERTLLIS
jgi:hypothetical protein